MAPREETSLINKSHLEYKSHPSDYEDIGDITLAPSTNCRSPSLIKSLLHNAAIIATSAVLVITLRSLFTKAQIKAGTLRPLGPYRLIEVHEGSSFFDHYDFYEGPDSLGSAGYNMYISKKDAEASSIVDIIQSNDEELVYMTSSPTKEGMRDSIRLEGKTRFDRGLFILDVRHMPNGPGVWPAFWLTDEDSWPQNGEMDILEGELSSWFVAYCVDCLT